MHVVDALRTTQKAKVKIL